MWGALVATPPHVKVAELRYQGVSFGQFFRNRVSDLCIGLRLPSVPGTLEAVDRADFVVTASFRGVICAIP